MRFDEIDTAECDFARVQVSPLPDVPTELTNNTVVEGTCASPVQFESQVVMLNIGGRNQLTTVCVWCGIEFNHDAVVVCVYMGVCVCEQHNLHFKDTFRGGLFIDTH